MIDHDSPAGSWSDALRYPHSIRILEEHPGDIDPLPSPVNCGAADMVAPDFSEQH